jgi:hypothetical protein
MNRLDLPNTNGAFPFLESIPNSNQPFILSVPYKGMILAQEVKALQLGKDMGVFQLPNQHLCASLKDRAYLHGNTLARPVVTRVAEINPQRRSITLTGFKTSPNPWRERTHERVQPAQPIQVFLTCHGQHCFSTIDDISLKGMGVLIYSSPEKDLILKRMENIRVSFSLPDDSLVYRLEGSMVYFTQISRTLAKLGIHFEPSRPLRARLDRYIGHRSMELLRELEIRWAKEQEPRGSVDLYF